MLSSTYVCCRVRNSGETLVLELCTGNGRGHHGEEDEVSVKLFLNNKPLQLADGSFAAPLSVFEDTLVELEARIYPLSGSCTAETAGNFG